MKKRLAIIQAQPGFYSGYAFIQFPEDGKKVESAKIEKKPVIAWDIWEVTGDGDTFITVAPICPEHHEEYGAIFFPDGRVMNNGYVFDNEKDYAVAWEQEVTEKRKQRNEKREEK
jgi:hypothetical protein